MKKNVSIMLLSLIILINIQGVVINASFYEEVINNSNEMGVSDFEEEIDGVDIRFDTITSSRNTKNNTISEFKYLNKENVSIVYDPSNSIYPYKDTDEDYVVFTDIITNDGKSWYLSIDYQVYFQNQEKKLHLILVEYNAIVEIVPVVFEKEINSVLNHKFIFSDSAIDLVDVEVQSNKGVTRRQFSITSLDTQISYIDELGEEISESDVFSGIPGLMYYVSPLSFKGYTLKETDGMVSGNFSTVLTNTEYIVFTNLTYGYEYHELYHQDKTVSVWIVNRENSLTSQRHIIKWGEEYRWTKQDWIDAGFPKMKNGAIGTQRFVQSDNIVFTYQKDEEEIDGEEKTEKQIEVHISELPKTGVMSKELVLIGTFVLLCSSNVFLFQIKRKLNK